MCSVKDCDMTKYKENDTCILHCKKENSKAEYHLIQNELKEFEIHFKQYIVDTLFNNRSEEHSFDKSMLMSFFTDNKAFHEVASANAKRIEAFIKTQTIIFKSISFPWRKGRDYFDYAPMLTLLNKIHFDSCKFYLSWLDIPETEIYFQDCEFYESWQINDYVMLDNVDDVIYQECVFHSNVSASNNGEKEIKHKLQNSQFMNCTFNKALELEHITIEKPLFNNSEYRTINMQKLDIRNCEFEDRFILNKYNIESVSITGSVFKKKFEFKENTTTSLNIENSNFTELAEFFGTSFIKFYIYKSIFTDYIGFEHCTFGKDDVDDIGVSEFKYSTFLNFVNFRNTKFLSGLDLENTNFKESPNFLKSEIDLGKTNRETFRILKYSFDKIGNHVEANRFFAFEMQKYKEELSSNSWYEQKKLVLWFNNKISNFGQDFYRPLAMLLLSIVIFSSLYYAFSERWLYKIAPDYNIYFENISAFINGLAKGFIPFSKFFVSGMEFISLLFYAVNLILIWQIVVAVKRHTRR